MVHKNGQKEKVRIIKVNESSDERSRELSEIKKDIMRHIPSALEIAEKVAEPLSVITEEVKRIRQACGGTVHINIVREIIEED